MRKIINFLKKLSNLTNRIDKLNNEVNITSCRMSRMLVENRILLKKISNQKLNIVLIAFEPATWLMFQSIYETFSKSEKINITVLVIPYAHSTLPAGTYKDDGLREYLDSIGIPYIYGYNEKTKTWIDIFNLHPDYVFYQAPYNGMYPDILKSNYVCRFAQICHVPYATILMKGKIEDVVYPIDFFTDSSYIFLENDLTFNVIKKYMSDKNRDDLPTKFFISGSTKLEAIVKDFDIIQNKKERFTILWLPRWNTNEGICSFFDYYNTLVDYIDLNINASLILRPHPLMLQNFLSTGEMTLKDIKELRLKFTSKNFILDESKNYINAFNSADVVIADPTSLIYEFFPTRKPIIYTEKMDVFNDFAKELVKGCYIVRTSNELIKCLDMISNNSDNLFEQRIEILNNYFNLSEIASDKILKKIIS